MQSTSTNGGAKGEMPKKDVAIYVDYENLYISLRSTVGQNPAFDVIMDKCREFGRVTIARAYADWSEFARIVTSAMFSSGVEPVYVPTRKFYDAKTRSQASKNSVDIHITIDIIKDVLTSKNIDIFVLVSGDRDFVPLMNQIRAAGKEVYAIGVAGCTSSELAVAVDEMFYYHQLLENEEELAAEQRDIYAKLARAIEIARLRGYRTTLGVIKPIMREVVVGFDERKFRNAKGVPYQKFKQFVYEAERNGFIKLVDSGGTVELGLVGDDIQRARRVGTEPEREPERARPVAPPRRAAVEAATDSAGEEAAEGTGGGRRRGRRGGRRRRKAVGPGGRPLAEGEANEAQEAAEGGEGDEGDEAYDQDAAPPPRAYETAEADDRIDDEADDGDAPRLEPAAARPSSRPVARYDRPRQAAGSAERAPAPVETAGDGDDDEGEDDWEAGAPIGGEPLPPEALDDLKAMLETFGGRAPSQRRLIARMKKGAAAGELHGRYHEGQFLLMVRKAMEAGHLEKVSKGFYSGLRWKDAPGATATV